MARKCLGYLGTVALSFAILFVFAKLALDKFEHDGPPTARQPDSTTSAAKTPGFQRARDTPEGSGSPTVRRAQQLLSKLGYDPGPVDGMPGIKTRLAVGRFQKDRGLAEDGTINRQLISALESAPLRASIPESSPLRVSAPGLGIRRASLQGLFESPEIGFEFENSPLADGRPRVTGTSKNGIALLELIGPPNNLSSATMTIGTPDDAPAAVAENSFYMMGFVKHAFPEWAGATSWVNSNLDRAVDSGEIRRVYGSKQISISVTQGLGMISITIKGTR
ncbi:MAG: peptidoglycan-binding domain-containing protein [Kiloniellales bacterium]